MRFQKFLLTVSAGLVLSSAHAGDSRFESYFFPRDTAFYGASIEPRRNGSPRVVSHAAGGVWVFKKSEQDTWTLNGHTARTELERPLLLPPAGPLFPDRLSELTGGFGYLNKLGDRHSRGVNVSLGSASDDLFHSIHETELSITGTAMLPSGPTNAWIFLLNYSNNRSFLNNIPLPGFAYMWVKPEKGLQIIAGFPFMMIGYRKGPWSASASAVGDTNQSLEVARRLVGRLEAYLGFEHSPEQWLRAGRDDNDKRLIYDEKKWLAGFRSPLTRVLSFDASAGRTFGRRVFEAKDASREASKLRLEQAWIFALQLSAKWGKKGEGHHP